MGSKRRRQVHELWWRHHNHEAAVLLGRVEIATNMTEVPTSELVRAGRDLLQAVRRPYFVFTKLVALDGDGDPHVHEGTLLDRLAVQVQHAEDEGEFVLTPGGLVPPRLYEEILIERPRAPSASAA